MPLSQQTILVTGGCGFIGANLVPKLLASGAVVHVLDDLSRGYLSYLDGYDITFTESDIRDTKKVTTACEGVDTVIHLAASGSVVESIADPAQNFDINARGTLSVLTAAQAAGVSTVLMASTGGAIMGDTTPPVNEQSLPRPISPYGASKLCGEAYCHAFAGSYGLRTLMTRFGNVYGPVSAHKKGAVTAFAKCLMTGQSIDIYGDGSASRDFLHVNDLCEGIIKAITSDCGPGSIFHLSSGKETSVAELAYMMKDIAGLPNHPINFHEARQGEVARNFANYDKAKEVLGFEPAYDLRAGLEQFWQWAQDESDSMINMKKSDS